MTVKTSVLGRVFRASVHPTAGRIVGGSVLVLATHGSVLHGSYPAGAPSGAWPKVHGGGTPPATKKAAPVKRPGRPAQWMHVVATISEI